MNTTQNRSPSSVPTALQSDNYADLKIKIAMRKMIAAEESLSAMAKKDVQINAVNGSVTLTGKVKSSEEKAVIAEFAKKAGAKAVNDELKVSIF